MKKQVLFLMFIFVGPAINSVFAFPPTLVSTYSVDPMCVGQDNGSITIIATGTGIIQYSIDNGNTFQSSNVFTGLAPGTYDIVVQDGTGTITAQEILSYQLTVVAAFTPSTNNGAAVLDVDFSNNSSGASGFSWNFDGSNSNSTLVNPSFSYDMPGTYTVTLVASENNCRDTATDVITVSGISEISMVPNVFSPNNDGINDLFFIKSIGIEIMEVFVYNRYGEVVYQWTGKNGYWDGHTYPAGQPVPDGTYYYFYKASGFDGVDFEDNGVINVNR